MDHPAVIFRFISDGKRRQGMAFREVLVTQVKEVLRAWLAGAGKRPAARRAGVRPARPAGHGTSWEALVPREAEIAGWVKDGLALVKIGELLERSGTAVP